MLLRSLPRPAIPVDLFVLPSLECGCHAPRGAACAGAGADRRAGGGSAAEAAAYPDTTTTVATRYIGVLERSLARHKTCDLSHLFRDLARNVG